MSTQHPKNQLEYIERARETHAYSKAVGKLFDLALSYIERGEEAVRSGRSAAWSIGVYEAPLFYACDTMPLSAIDLGRLSSRNSVEVAETELDLPKETCSMISVLLGEWILRRNSPVKKIVAFGNACEPFNMAYELIRSYGYDVHRVEGTVRPLQNNDGQLERAADFLEKELASLARWLNGGRPLDEARMAEEIRRMNRILGKVRRIMQLRLENPLYLKSLPTMFMLMGTGHYYGDPERFEQVLDELIQEMTSAPIIRRPDGKPVIPLTWIGARGLEFGVFQSIDDLGGALLSWYTPNPYRKNWREDVPPLRSMAYFLLDYMLVTSPVQQIQGIEEMIRESGSKGIICYNYIGCAFGGVHVEIFRNYFQNKGVPAISLDGSFQVGRPSGQLITRIKAFIEMLS